ncbi:MAG: outer membrane lipid asymmetry maintenance protein MlaD [Candidatus Binatia bacterium]
MNETRKEITVGVFVLVGIVCLGYLAIRLGKLEVMGNNGYVVYGDFVSVAGLKIGDPIEIAGVKVGKVESIALADDRARLGLRVEPQVKLQEDVIASVRARGLIGDKFITLTPGASDKLLGPGDKIRETESPADITELIGKYVGGDFTSKSGKK